MENMSVSRMLWRICVLWMVLVLLGGPAGAIPDPSAVYCSELGYEYVIRTDEYGSQYGACVFPDGSECSAWAYFSKCYLESPSDDCEWPCQELPCKEAGEMLYIGECCEGLSRIRAAITYDDDCNDVGIGGPGSICSDCGNGRCESWESKCNCPIDCREPEVIYVDANAPGADDGTSWEDAYNFLQDALADANLSEKPVEIRVAQGVYTPDSSSAVPGGTGEREAAFGLIAGVAVWGGYEGFGEAEPDDRDIEKYETVLSGDIGGNDVGDLRDASRDDNSYHVVTGDDPEIGQSTVLDGFTIRGGNANGLWEEGYGDGGGIFCYGSGPTIRNCVICENSVGYLGHGGGMCSELGNPAVVKCTFRGNLADRYGGGMLNYLGSATLVDCRFVGNSTRSGGGAVFNWSSDVSLTNCVFVGNSATDDSGGGMHNYDSDVTLSGCVFSGNSSQRNGGGVYIYEASAKLTNCTFSGNSAADGGGLYNYKSSPVLRNCMLTGNRAERGGAIANQQNQNAEVLVNCILWGNVPDQWYGGWPVTSYSVVQGDAGFGIGNIDADPCFADPGYWDQNETPDDANDDFWVDGDYHLKSEAGRWDANEGQWTRDDVTSPCIDAGNPMSPIGLEPFPNGGIVNMGAYGGTAEASKSYFGEPPCETIIAGDINGDCIVDFGDFCIMALHWCEDNNP